MPDVDLCWMAELRRDRCPLIKDPDSLFLAHYLDRVMGYICRVDLLSFNEKSEMILYGIKNCNTVKSAIEWLTKHKVAFEFHDYKSKGVTEAKLKDWSSQVGWETLVNKRGTTWRTLSPEAQAKITTEAAAIKLMKESTSIIKRPLIEHQGKVVTVGFDQNEYHKIFR